MEAQTANVSSYLLRPCRTWDEAVRDLSNGAATGTPMQTADPPESEGESRWAGP